MKFNLISLGCAKNLVDSEYLYRKLEEGGFSYDNDADFVIINTCAFIEDAKKESIDTILSFAKRKKVVVVGCLVERYGDKLLKLLPEVDLFVGRGFYPEILSVLKGRGLFLKKEPFFETFPRKILTEKPVAFLKIQEGCSRRCTYCAIPSIRGKIRSLHIEDIEKEFYWLLDQGYKEINIVAQDITSYGKDIGTDLKGLLRNLLKGEGDFFIRLLYLHPKGIDAELLRIISSEDRIIKYLDIPIQHCEDKILRAMGRGYTKDFLERLFGFIREKIKDVTLRTTVMVGFPGEKEKDFENLLSFIKKWKFDMLGAFLYSKEEGTKAFSLKEQVPKKVKKERYERIMEEQLEISRERLKRFKGKKTKVIVEGEGGDFMIGRTLFQAPLSDGVALIKGDCKKGDIKEGIILETLDYDVIVEVKDEAN